MKEESRFLFTLSIYISNSSKIDFYSRVDQNLLSDIGHYIL